MKMENTAALYLDGEFLNGDLLKISVVADGFDEGVLGTAFKLDYPVAQVAFLKYEPGEFLESGGDPFYLVKDAGDRLVFGQTLRRDDQFPDGGGRVVDFYFQILEERDLSFEFVEGVVSKLDSLRQDLDAVEFRGETFVRDDTEELVEISNDISGLEISESTTVSGFGNYMTWVALAVLVASFGLFISKSSQKKSTKTYVNFK